MNRLCGGDSAWKVMRERTTDFQADVPLVSNTAPVFEVLQLTSVRSVVLVLDISISMAVSLCLSPLPPSPPLPLSLSLSTFPSLSLSLSQMLWYSKYVTGLQITKSRQLCPLERHYLQLPRSTQVEYMGRR